MTWRIAIDIGGTFTDVVALNENNGQLNLVKVRSTPSDPANGFIDGIAHIRESAAIDASDIGSVFHGTTVATNAILERKYFQLGLITTQGYREALECGRQTVPGEFGDITWWIKPPRAVPLELVREISERIAVDGSEVRAVVGAEVEALAEEFKSLGVKAIAVSLIHSYRNPTHEQQVRDIIKAVYPDCFISISSDILREYREYERTNTTCLNTALMPLLSAYHDKLDDHLKSQHIEAPFYIMRSSGGLANAEEISRMPITAALSGPAAGVIAATHFAQLSGFEDVITFDVGGTSADICLVENGTPRMLTEGKVDIYDVKTPMVDIHAVGAGGGSIAWLAGGRSLKVGPDSAGADPGPACYGRGGKLPTVTDANLVLGRITPALAGGDISLDRDKAVVAVQSLADQLGLDLNATADGILRIAIENMAGGIRTVSVKRGRDPRDYALVAFGGAGPLHACYLADWLNMQTVIVPPSPGVTSAYGLLLTDVRVDLVHTNVQREDQINLDVLNADIAALEQRVKEKLATDGFKPVDTRLTHFLDMRYVGQAYEIRIPVNLSEGAATLNTMLQQSIADFHFAHKDLYGYSYEGTELVEIVNSGVTGLGLLKRPHVASSLSESTTIEDAKSGVSAVYFPQTGAHVDSPIYERSKLPDGAKIEGPAIIKQYDSTTVVNPGWVGNVESSGSLVLRKV